jgi:hypothetical protein
MSRVRIARIISVGMLTVLLAVAPMTAASAGTRDGRAATPVGIIGVPPVDKFIPKSLGQSYDYFKVFVWLYYFLLK